MRIRPPRFSQSDQATYDIRDWNREQDRAEDCEDLGMDYDEIEARAVDRALDRMEARNL